MIKKTPVINVENNDQFPTLPSSQGSEAQRKKTLGQSKTFFQKNKENQEPPEREDKMMSMMATLVQQMSQMLMKQQHQEQWQGYNQMSVLQPIQFQDQYQNQY